MHPSQSLVRLGLAAFVAAYACYGQATPGTERAVPDARRYRIGPGDILQIEVWKEPEASVPSVTVRPDGSISLPILGELRASGLLAMELQQTLCQKYGEFIRNARVTVMVREINSQKIYLIGEVRREGPIRLVAPITVLQALAEAGGLTDYAKRKRIYIIRSEGDRRAFLPFDYEAVVRGEKIEQNIEMLPGDTIVVPR